LPDPDYKFNRDRLIEAELMAHARRRLTIPLTGYDPKPSALAKALSRAWIAATHPGFCWT
jgi:hypothetical protein